MKDKHNPQFNNNCINFFEKGKKNLFITFSSFFFFIGKKRISKEWGRKEFWRMHV